MKEEKFETGKECRAKEEEMTMNRYCKKKLEGKREGEDRRIRQRNFENTKTEGQTKGKKEINSEK